MFFQIVKKEKGVEEFDTGGTVTPDFEYLSDDDNLHIKLSPSLEDAYQPDFSNFFLDNNDEEEEENGDEEKEQHNHKEKSKENREQKRVDEEMKKPFSKSLNKNYNTNEGSSKSAPQRSTTRALRTSTPILDIDDEKKANTVHKIGIPIKPKKTVTLADQSSNNGALQDEPSFGASSSFDAADYVYRFYNGNGESSMERPESSVDDSMDLDNQALSKKAHLNIFSKTGSQRKLIGQEKTLNMFYSLTSGQTDNLKRKLPENSLNAQALKKKLVEQSVLGLSNKNNPNLFVQNVTSNGDTSLSSGTHMLDPSTGLKFNSSSNRDRFAKLMKQLDMLPQYPTSDFYHAYDKTEIAKDIGKALEKGAEPEKKDDKGDKQPLVESTTKDSENELDKENNAQAGAAPVSTPILFEEQYNQMSIEEWERRGEDLAKRMSDLMLKIISFRQ